MSHIDRSRRPSVYSASRRGSLGYGLGINGALEDELPKIGARVVVHDKKELDDPQGKNEGVVQGKRYFTCRRDHGIFVRASQVKVLPSTPRTSEDGVETSDRILRDSPPSPRRSRRESMAAVPKPKPSKTTATTAQGSVPAAGRQRSGTQGSIRISTQPRTSSREAKVQSRPPRSRPVSTALEYEDDNSTTTPMTEDSGTEDKPSSSERESSPVPLEVDTKSSSSSEQITLTTEKEPSPAILQTVPRKDYEELRLKLKIIESKRQEDRERIREYEKIKDEAEQFLTLRNRLQDKIVELQKDLRETKRSLQQNVEEKESLEAKHNEVLESLEWLTVDKEMAEERSENLQQEVTILRDKLEETTVSLEVLKNESESIGNSLEEGGDKDLAVEVTKLERHNERLKEALMRLRDATTQQETKLHGSIKQLEQENHSLKNVHDDYLRVKEKLQAADEQIDDLKRQLDDAMSSEELIDQLTEKNLNLTERIEEMRSSIQDLEALKELADELEENHVENEKQFEAEIENRDLILREQKERQRALEDANSDYELTIQQFRELVRHLQSDLEQLRLKEQSQETEKQTLSSQSQAMMSLNMQLQSTVVKTQAKAIDLELRKLDAAQANERLNYIQPYLPESFFKTENDSILCLLLFKRLVFKAELIGKNIDQNYPVNDDSLADINETSVAMCEIRQKVGWLGDVAKRFVNHIKHCKPDAFIEVGKLLRDLIATERRLNVIVEHFRLDQVKESEVITELQRINAQLEHLSESYLAKNDEAGPATLFFGLTRSLELNADQIMASMYFIKKLIGQTVSQYGLTTEDTTIVDTAFMEPLGRLVSLSKDSKMRAKKMMRRLEDLSDEAMTLQLDYLHHFKTMQAMSTKVTRFCVATQHDIAAYVDIKRSEEGAVDMSQVQGIVRQQADDILEIAERSLWEGGLTIMRSLAKELQTTLDQVNNDNKKEKIPTVVAPWVQRASNLKAEVYLYHDQERKLQQQTDEIVKLVRDIKSRDQLLQESAVKVELLERRVEIARKESEQIAHLEENLQKSHTQEQMYAEAMESLQAEYDTLEQENLELKKTLSTQEEKRRSMSHRISLDMATSHEALADMEETMVEHSMMHHQLETLKGAVRFLRAENAHLKSRDLVRSLHIDFPNPTLDRESSDSETRRSLSVASQKLLKDWRKASACARVVRLSDPTAHRAWEPRHKSPHYQHQTQQSVLFTLKRQSERLQAMASTLFISDPHEPSQVDVRPITQVNNWDRPVAKIQVPRTCTGDNKHERQCRVHIKTPNELERLHSMLIQ